MDDRAEVGQCAHQIGIDRDLAGIDNRPRPNWHAQQRNPHISPQSAAPVPHISLSARRRSTAELHPLVVRSWPVLTPVSKWQSRLRRRGERLRGYRDTITYPATPNTTGSIAIIPIAAFSIVRPFSGVRVGIRITG